MKLMKSIAFAAACAAGTAVYADLPNWTVTWTNEDQTVGLCSNDQNSFVLNVYRDANSAHGGFGLAIGLKGATTGSAVASVDGSEYLDLRDFWKVTPWLETRLAGLLEKHLTRYE